MKTIEEVMSITGFTYQKGKAILLKDMDLSVWKGELLAIVGLNGAGKTSLIRALAGFYRGKTGEVRLFGVPMTYYRRKDIARKIAYVPQTIEEGVPEVSVEDFVLMGRLPYASLFSGYSSEDKEYCRRALELVGILKLRDRKLGDLSGGERRRVSIGRAIAQNTDILLLDEPLSYLDMKNQLFTLKLLRALRDEGRSVVCVMHDVNAVLNWADYVAVLKNGAMVAYGKPQMILTPKTLQKAFSVDAHIFSHGDSRFIELRNSL